MSQPGLEGSTPPPGAGNSAMGVQYSASGQPGSAAVSDVAAATGSGRTPVLTGVAVYFFIRAGLGALALLALVAAGSSADNGQNTAPTSFYFLGGAGVAYFCCVVGLRLLRSDVRGRVLGIRLCGAGVLLALIGVAMGSAAAAIAGLFDGLALWFLLTTRELIRR